MISVYDYKAKIIRVVDADTLDAEVQLGFHVTARIRFRLGRINAPEIRGKEKERGKEATAWLTAKLNQYPDSVVIQSSKTGKFGRWLGEIFANGENLNDALVKAGHAVYVEY